jgi:hypothetical protein
MCQIVWMHNTQPLWYLLQNFQCDCAGAISGP